MEARNDWSLVDDFVEAFQKIIRQKKPDNFIIASGEAHTVREFATLVFKHFGLKSEKYITETPRLLKRQNRLRIGNTYKLKKITGWKPNYNFKSMVKKLVDDYCKTRS